MATKTEAKPKTPDAAKAAEAAEAPPSKKKLWIVGAVVACAAGSLLAFMAAPKHAEPKPELEGPFVARLSKQDVQVNLAGENGKRYLVLGLNAEYFAYDESFVAARLGNAAAGGEHGAAAAVEDPLYTAMLKDLLVRMASRKTREHVEDPVQMEAFLAEIRTAVEPLLFPVCIGDSVVPQHPDKKSGLRVGESIMESTMRGMLHDHELDVSAPAKTIRLDQGPVVSFTGEERDLKLEDEHGAFLYVNVTGLDPKFVGKVPIGVAGRVRRIYREQLLMQ